MVHPDAHGPPANTTMVVLVFMWIWNEFLIPLVMSPTGAFRTAPLGLAFFKGMLEGAVKE